MGLFDKLLGKKENEWEQSSGNVYPQNSISLLMLETESGKPATAWVDNAYHDYKYKNYCPYNFLLTIDLTDEIATRNENIDMGMVEDYFVSEVRKICIAHIVARVPTDVGMNIEMYVEELNPAMGHLKEIFESDTRLVTFGCEINQDPEWKAVEGLMNIN